MSTLRVATLQTPAGVEVYTCKAWVNFNGTGTVAIRASGNVSSVTDNGVGDYTVNFSAAMVDANYSMSSNAILEGNVGAWVNPFTNATYLTGSIRIKVINQSSGAFDSPAVSVSIFR